MQKGIITSSNKKDLKYEAATVNSIFCVQLGASYNDTKREVLIGCIFKNLNHKAQKKRQGFFRLILK